ncbi:MAG: hypothetical protein AAGH46_05840, partial [Bacteroidota bacterium]
MIQTLIGKIPENLSKAFVVTGLMPTLLFFFIVLSYIHGFDYVNLKVNILSQGDWFTHAFLDFTILTIVAIGFYSLKEFFNRVLERLPGRLLTPLRQQLTKYYIRLRENSIKEQSMIEYNITAVSWYCSSNGAKSFYHPQLKPPNNQEPTYKEAMSSSTNLIKKLIRYDDLNYYTPSAQECDYIVYHLTRFYIAGVKYFDTKHYRKEINQWKTI